MTSGDPAGRSVLAHRPVEPFVGRARELDRICSAGEALSVGRGHLVVVSGEAGVGKSRFCTEVADRYRTAGAQVVEARCWLDGGAPPLWPWQPILDELCGSSTGSRLLTTGVEIDDIGPDRFARFVAVTDRIAEACATTPLVLIIDDVQGADYGALLLIRFVARSLARLPLLLVLGRRRGEPAEGGDEARLLDEIEREATPVLLGDLDHAETEAFLDAHGIDPDGSDLLTTVYNLTRGHPLHLRRIVQTIRTTGAPVLRGGVRTAIRHAFDTLGDEDRRLLSHGAVLGPDPVVAEVAAVAGCEAVRVLDAARAGLAAGLVAALPDEGWYSFGHDLVRATIEDGSPPTAHRLARAARHARAAAPRSREDARRAVTLCESAAQAVARNYAYEQADELFTAAVELHATARLGPPGALLTLQWAQAAAQRGHLRAMRERYGVAITRAQAEDRPGLLAEALLGWGGIWLDDYPTPVDKARMLGLYRKALDGLPSGDPRYEAQRCRLRVRLAGESAYTDGSIDELHHAVAATRATGDPHALAEALSLAQHALFTQDHGRTRLALNDELIEITTETDQGVLALMGLLWRTVNLLHLGDPQFARALEVLREQATALGNEHMRYHVAVIDVLVDIGQGRLDDAGPLRCQELGEQIGRVDVPAYVAAQIATMRWLQGRDAEMLQPVSELASSPILGETEFSVWALAACLAARAGDHDRANAVLRHCLPTRLSDLAPSGTWMVGMVALVEAAVALGDHDLAAQAHDLLEPYADLPAVAGLGIVCLGSVERSLGLACGVLGRHDEAVAHLERAVVANQKIVNRSLLTLSRAELAVALLRRPNSSTDDRRRAEGLLRDAVRDGRAMGLSGRVVAWEDELTALFRRAEQGDEHDRCHPPGTDRGHDDRSPATPGVRHGVVRRDGRRWVVAVDGRGIRVPNLVGMRYLAELLTNPATPIPAVTLAARSSDPSPPHRQEMLDEQARSTYAARARELAADLADAEAANDLHRAERIRAEMDLLVDQLEAATGLDGRPRHFPDDHERARVAVQKAIKRAVDAIEDGDPTVAQMLRETISTGATCVYTPARTRPVSWSARDEDPGR